MNQFNSTERFSDRVSDYVKFRPSYPPELITYLKERADLTAIADLGSGTGILTKLLLATGAEVFGVEPNQGMRQAAEHYLSHMKRFHSIGTAAEDTGLPAECVNLVTIAQAFHWLDPAKTRSECLRILKPGGFAAIIWNNSKKEANDFAREYERLRKAYASTEITELSRYAKTLDAQTSIFFGTGKWERVTFSNFQNLDAEGLVGRFFSASYSPKIHTPERTAATAELLAAFKRFKQSGIVRMELETEIFFGQLT